MCRPSYFRAQQMTRRHLRLFDLQAYPATCGLLWFRAGNTQTHTFLPEAGSYSRLYPCFGRNAPNISRRTPSAPLYSSVPWRLLARRTDHDQTEADQHADATEPLRH